MTAPPARAGRASLATRLGGRPAGIALAGILALAAALRLAAIGYDLPFFYDPDEWVFIFRAGRILATGDPDPGWYGHPGQFTIYLNALVFAGLALAALVTGAVDGAGEVVAWFEQDRSAFVLAGRLVVAAFSVAIVALSAGLSRRLGGGAGTVALAALLVAIAPLLVDFGFLIRPDNQMTVFALLAVLAAVRLATAPRPGLYLAAGAALGVAVSCKYPAVVFAVAIVAAHAFAEEGRVWRRAHRLAAAGAASLAACFVTAPFLFLEFGAVLADVGHEARDYHLSAASAGPLSALAWYGRTVFLPAGGPLGLALFCVAAAGAVARRDRVRRDGARGVVVVAALAYLAFIVSLPLQWERWLIPLLPLYLVVVALGAGDVARAAAARWRARRRAGVGVMVGLGLLLVAPTGWITAGDLVAELRGQTRTETWRYLMEEVPQGSRLLMERYTAQPPRGRFALFEVDEAGAIVPVDGPERFAVPQGVTGRLPPGGAVAAIEAAEIDYLVLGDDYARRKAEPARHADAVAVYETLLDRYPTVFATEPRRWVRAGRENRVLRVE
ncbi:MAG: glycosyltransferase family 39 protein [Azospirillaceae bacterium]